MRNSFKNKEINIVLLFIAATISVIFNFMIESFNDLALDDIGFAYYLKDNSVFDFIYEMYFTWQGRYTMFLITGLQIKSYFFFEHMLPFALLLYVFNVLLLAVSLKRFYNLKIFEGILFSLILFQLFIFTYYDLSSYFWLCTKPYTLQMTLSVYGASELYKSKLNSKISFLILFFVSVFIGSSYEIYSPLILLILGSLILIKFHKMRFHFLTLLTNKKLLFVFIVSTVAFFIMVIAPGNWLRKGIHDVFSNLSAVDLLKITALNTTQLGKVIVLKLHYLIVAAILLYSLALKDPRIKLHTKKYIKNIFSSVLLIGITGLVLIAISVLLNTYAVGHRMELRAFNHVNLIIFIVIGSWMLLYSEVSKNERSANVLLFLALIFFITINTYSIKKNYNELKFYGEAKADRMRHIDNLKAAGNIETIKLNELPTPIFRSVDDFWKLLIPELSPRPILKPNEISYDVKNHYNVTYRFYYGLDFNVYNTISFDLE